MIHALQRRLPEEYALLYKDKCIMSYQEALSFIPKHWGIYHGAYELAEIDMETKTITIYKDKLYVLLHEVARMYGYKVL